VRHGDASVKPDPLGGRVVTFDLKIGEIPYFAVVNVGPTGEMTLATMY
jgi:hypothetical protein